MFTEQPDHCRHHYDLQENSEINGKMLSEFQMSATENKWVQQKRYLLGRVRPWLLEGALLDIQKCKLLENLLQSLRS